LYENEIPYQIKMINNTLRISNRLQNRVQKNYYKILVKEEYKEMTREVLKQCGIWYNIKNISSSFDSFLILFSFFLMLLSFFSHFYFV
jgi:hypothetical protein